MNAEQLWGDYILGMPELSTIRGVRRIDALNDCFAMGYFLLETPLSFKDSGRAVARVPSPV